MVGGCLPSNRIQIHFPTTSAKSQKRGARVCNRRKTRSVGKPRLYRRAAKSMFNNFVLFSICCAVRFMSPESEFVFVFIIFFLLCCAFSDCRPSPKKPAQTGRPV